ncbi:hypothetical protein MAHJHV55_17680 [Mycobacterium avium subsp. hominissuis]
MTLVHGNAHGLPFDEASFDTVVCTFGLCSIPDVDTAIGEMHRILRPGGGLLLADHIASSSRPRAVQWLVERLMIPLAEEHFRRRPLKLLPGAAFAVDTVGLRHFFRRRHLTKLKVKPCATLPATLLAHLVIPSRFDQRIRAIATVAPRITQPLEAWLPYGYGT